MLSLTVGLNDKVVVAARVILTAVAARAVDGPYLVGLDGSGSMSRDGDRD